MHDMAPDDRKVLVSHDISAQMREYLAGCASQGSLAHFLHLHQLHWKTYNLRGGIAGK